MALALFAAQTRADLPLTVEDLITDKGQFKLDLSIAYTKSDRQGVSTGAPISVQTGSTAFVELPTLIGESTGNSDIAVATLGLRFGLTAQAEVFARVSGLASQQRSRDWPEQPPAAKPALLTPGPVSTTN
jgi:hypothetical protein